MSLACDSLIVDPISFQVIKSDVGAKYGHSFMSRWTDNTIFMGIPKVFKPTTIQVTSFLLFLAVESPLGPRASSGFISEITVILLGRVSPGIDLPGPGV